MDDTGEGNYKNFEQKEVAARGCSSMSSRCLSRGKPEGYDSSDLIEIIKYHKPDILIGASRQNPEAQMDEFRM